MIEVLILSLVQGITEFIPVSSSSHLILISDFVDFDSQSLSIDVSLHIGSFLAVVSYFYKDILNFLENRDLFIKILISSLPVILAGFVLIQTDIIDDLRSVKIIGWTTIIFGVLLYISDRFKLDKEISNNFNLKSALIIGLFQVLSLVPGVSRSGITITAARLLNYKRLDAAKISFLLSIPTLASVSFFGIFKLTSSENLSFSVLNLISIILSFLFSYLTIKYFIRYIKRFSLIVFIIYRIILGLIILSFIYL
tara:strand:- start:806 stop:1564 length:759 start_codon:yes stop_codon:yes gene_type:complete